MRERVALRLVVLLVVVAAKKPCTLSDGPRTWDAMTSTNVAPMMPLGMANVATPRYATKLPNSRPSHELGTMSP
jgi:hypothetical protein